MRLVSYILAGVLAVLSPARGQQQQESAGPGDAQAKPQTAVAGTTDGLDWMTDYPRAMQRASQERKMLLVYFRESAPPAHRSFQNRTLADPGVRQRLADYVLLQLPTSATAGDGQTRLLEHGAFQYMYGRSGVAILDMKHSGEPYYGYVVSCFPFESPAYYCPNYESAQSIRTILELPPGSITQRTMIYAVRMHPERPRSTSGRAHPVLLDAARGHSRYQARIRLLGHHGWAARSQNLWGRLRGGAPASEVCAQSWPGSNLVTACLDCVHSWRQSPGHWSSVRAPARLWLRYPPGQRWDLVCHRHLRRLTDHCSYPCPIRPPSRRCRLLGDNIILCPVRTSPSRGGTAQNGICDSPISREWIYRTHGSLRIGWMGRSSRGPTSRALRSNCRQWRTPASRAPI